jgi:alpha-L-fucosidase
MKQISIFIVLYLLSATPLFSQNSNDFKSDKAEQMQWWTEARFGMFIHWGLYAFPTRHE